MSVDPNVAPPEFQDVPDEGAEPLEHSESDEPDEGSEPPDEE